MKFGDCSESLEAMGLIEMPITCSHNQGADRIQPEFAVMENATPDYFIQGSDFFSVSMVLI